MAKDYIYTIGRRKTTLSQLRLIKSGTGQILVNNQEFKNYFTTLPLQEILKEPLKFFSQKNSIDLNFTVSGGGKNSQAQACRHALARALVQFDVNVKPALKKSGFLTRDSRVKERKKPGLKRARRAPQWQKR